MIFGFSRAKVIDTQAFFKYTNRALLGKTTQVALIDLSMIADCTPDSENLTAEDLTSPEFFKYCAIVSELAEQLIEKKSKLKKHDYQWFF